MSKKEIQQNNETNRKEAAALFANIFVELIDYKYDLLIQESNRQKNIKDYENNKE